MCTVVASGCGGSLGGIDGSGLRLWMWIVEPSLIFVQWVQHLFALSVVC